MTYQTVAAFTQSFSTVLFFALFIGVVIYAVWPGNRKSFDYASRIPFDNDEHDPTFTRDTGGRK
ncbi:MAG: cbb3-type cytochrome c oxidase subunit 3 [Filomicrobium sp.]